MKSPLSPRAQFRSSWPIIGLVLTVSVGFVGVVLLLHFWKGVSIDRLTRDPIVVVGAPLYTGFLSQIGILLWSASAAVCMFSAKVLSRHSDSSEARRFLFVSGLLTLVLGLDDAFLLHEKFFPYFGIPEIAIYISYVGFMLFFLVRFYSTILKTEYMLLGMALVSFGVSITFDLFEARGLGSSFLFEDSAKLVGIVSWLSYFLRVAAFAVYRSAAQQGAAPDA